MGGPRDAVAEVRASKRHRDRAGAQRLGIRVGWRPGAAGYGCGEVLQADADRKIWKRAEEWGDAMKCYVGLDVSMRETAICVVDEKREVVK